MSKAKKQEKGSREDEGGSLYESNGRRQAKEQMDSRKIQ